MKWIQKLSGLKRRNKQALADLAAAGTIDAADAKMIAASCRAGMRYRPILVQERVSSAVHDNGRSRCACGHEWGKHERIDGDEYHDTIWVCTGSRLADVNAPDFHPYALACGCFQQPPTRLAR